MRHFSVLITTLAVLALPAAAPAATRYVAPAGSDTGNDCTVQTAPCASFDRAYQVATLGDTVHVAAGTYPGQILRQKSGTNGLPASTPKVVFQPAPGVTRAQIVLGAPGQEKNCLGFDGSDFVEVRSVTTVTSTTSTHTAAGVPVVRENQCNVGIGRNGAEYIVIDDVDSGGVWVSANHVTVRNNDIGPAGCDCGATSGIFDNSTDVVFEDNFFHDFRIHYEWDPVNQTWGSLFHQQCFMEWDGTDVRMLDNRWQDCDGTAALYVEAANNVSLDDHLIQGNTFLADEDPSDPSQGNNTLRIGADRTGAMNDLVVTENRVLTGALSLIQGAGGGTGDITITDNDVLGSFTAAGLDCMAATLQGPALYNPDGVPGGGTYYSCGGNRVWADSDGDLVHDDDDNCPDDPNPNQADSDSDGIGDVCDSQPGFVGWDDLQPEEDWTGSGEAEAFQTVAQEGVIDQLHLFVPESDEYEGVAGELELAAYTNTLMTNHPDQLLGKCVVEDVVEDAWNSCELAVPFELGNGVYWLSVLAPEGSGEPEFLDNCCGDGTDQVRASATTTLTTHPSSWTTGWNGRLDGPVSFYGD